MKILSRLLLVAFLATSFGCSTEGGDSPENGVEVKSQKSQKKASTPKPTVTAADKADIIDKFSDLFEELISFKGKSDFHALGFSASSPYNSWLKKVRALKSHPASKTLIQKGFVVGDLEMLGQEYRSSKGKETEYSRFMKSTIQKGL